jgi:sulfite exporter TauE/SafE/copper chaperone CopZ
MKQQIIPIKGMHCKSCEILIGEELEALPDIEKIEVSLKTRTATVYGKHLPSHAVLSKAIQAAGYEIGTDITPYITANRKVLKDVGIGIALVVIVGIVFSQFNLSKIADVNVAGAGVGVIALIVGLTAGFSTCMAMVGGLVLSVSARHAEKHPTATPMQKFRPHLYFNFGRIISFMILGGAIGAVGAAFQLKGSLLGLLTIVVGAVMLLLGLQLTELFPRLRGAITLPSSVGRFIGIKKRGEREYSHKDAMLLGAATFFLPCGFTQAMQLLAVSTGSPVQGAIIMGAFAVGTAPGLLSIGGLTSVVKGVFAQRFFRVVGVAVVAMAILNFSNGYNLMGIGRIVSRIVDTAQSSQTSASTTDTSQNTTGSVMLNTSFKLKSDISPSSFMAKVGQKTTLVVDVQEDGHGCMSTIMIPELSDNAQYLKAGKKINLTFTPTKAGTYPITCAMGIQRGSIKVEE